jgi:hypothetical protein
MQGLAASIGVAAALPEGLKLQSLSTNSVVLLTKIASCSSLTQLQLQLFPETLGFRRSFIASGGKALPQAIAAVTGAQLTLHKHASPKVGCCGGVMGLLYSVSALLTNGRYERVCQTMVGCTVAVWG